MDGIELMASAMHAAKSRLDVSAGNLANVSSDGFHKRVAHAVLTANGLVSSSDVDPAQGPLKRTGRNFDLALVGAGGFFVRDATGRVLESRSGSFARNALGQLANERGEVLLGARGPVVAAADATIDARGVVRDAGVEVGGFGCGPARRWRAAFSKAPMSTPCARWSTCFPLSGRSRRRRRRCRRSMRSGRRTSMTWHG